MIFVCLKECVNVNTHVQGKENVTGFKKAKEQTTIL